MSSSFSFCKGTRLASPVTEATLVATIERTLLEKFNSHSQPSRYLVCFNEQNFDILFNLFGLCFASFTTISKSVYIGCVCTQDLCDILSYVTKK